MYAIVKTGGKQYKVAPGDKVNVEKIDAEVGSKVELQAICVVDGENVVADPAKAAETKVVAVVIEQFKGEKQIVFKFKRRKNYKKLQGHRQKLTRLQIESVGAEKAEVAVSEPVEAPAAVEAPAEFTREALEALKVAELKEIAAEKGLKTSGLKKAELVGLILDAE